MNKRILSLILSLALVAGLMPTTVFAADPVTAGAFTLTSDSALSEGTDYEYSDGTLTIKTSKAVTIANTDPSAATSDNIAVAAGVSANITLAGVNIRTSGRIIGKASPLHMSEAGNSTLTLQDGTVNMLDGSSAQDFSPGIMTPDGTTLTIKGSGTLTAKGSEHWPGIGRNGTGNNLIIEGGTINAVGGASAAAIGGSNGGENSGGTVTIRGGTVTATGGITGIGGGSNNGKGANVTITGGRVTASGSVVGIGAAGDNIGTFNTNGGNAVIFASSISDKTQQNSWSGIIFDGDSGKVYGDQTLMEDLEIPSGKVLEVPQNTTLIISGGVTLTNNGMVTNSGAINNYGTFTGNGALDGNAVVEKYVAVVCALTNLISSNTSDIHCADNDYTATLTAEEGYVLPSTVTVTVNGSVLTAGESTYTYDSTNGVLTIKAAAITGDILITASAAELGADLTVTAANSGEELIYGTDYTYPADTGVLTILSDKAIIISNADPDTAADHRICVEDGVNANITLSNVNIDVIGTSGACAFEVAGSADCNLTLAGTNTLKSGGERAGLEAGETAVLTITEDSTGSLTAKGGSNSAGIGGGGFFQSAGTITIKGGTVTASGGDYGAGIGGGRIGSGGTIVISGGTVTASGGSYGAGIGNGDAAESGTFTTGTNGDAIIFASSVADKTNQNSWSGIIFEGNNGKVYGSQTLTEDFEISGDKVLDISENTTLSINTDVTLVNYGTINAAGTLTNSGELVNYGTITNSGTLTNSGKIGVIIDKGTVTGSQIKGDSPIDAYEVSAVLTNMTSGGKIYALWGEDYTAALAVSAAAADYSLPKRIKVSVDGKLLTAGDDTYTYDSETGEVTIKAEAVTGNILITADGLYNMAAADFTVSATNGGETLIYGIDYTYPADTSVLTILSDKAITISNADPDTATYHRICVEDGVNANVTFAGVNIHTQGNGSPFSIADHSTGDVTVTLADGTENVLISGSTDAAGLQKNGDVSSGTLTINGNGALTATGNWNGPGIGGNPAANIVIESGTIIANGTAGAGIGSTYRSNASNIIIRGGTVTAAGGVRTTHGTSYYGAGIGSGANGSASNIVITGGSVYATAQGDAQPIGKGSGSGTADAPTDGSGNPVYLYEIENPQKANITINGKDYPDTHGEDAKIYAYLPAKTAQDPNVVTVGDATTKLYYNSGRLIEVVGIPAADSTTFTYTGQEQTYTIAESDYYTISGNLQTNAGTHTVMVSLKDKNNTAWSDGTTEDKTYSFVIGKAMPQEGYVPDCELTLTENTDGTFTAAITPVDGAEYSFDGQNWSNSNTKKVNHKEDVTGYIRYAETDNYVAGKAASKTVKAGHGTLEHYNAAEAACTADGNIEYYYCPICKEYFSDAGAQNEIEYNDTVIEAKGHDFSGDFDAYDENGHWHICNREDCTATDTPVSHSFTSYIYNNDATYFENGTETAVCDAAGCEQTHTRTKEGTMLVDTAAPTGEIKVKENTWKSFINTITFDIFCKDKYDVIVTANDGETGVVSVEYLLSETAISESDIANKTGWKAYSAFSIEDEGKYIIYAKISDNAGNVIYISSDGMVIDKTVPVISGLQNNKTYCGEVTFTVDDEYIDYVTVNGARVNDYTLKADGTGYTVKAYDKAGNESLTYTVTVNDGHTFTDYVSNNDAACTEDGTETAKCDFCDATDTRTDIGSATGHTLTKTDGKPATHLTVGNTDYWYCDSCKKYFSDEAGINEIDLEDTVIPKLTEHTADGTSWHTDGDSHWHTCECGEVIDKAAHTYEWVIDRKATETEAGLKHEQCTVCSYAKAGVEIPATGSTPDQTSLQTGDDSNIVLWITVMLTAGAALTGTVLYSRKKKNSR